MEPAQHTPASGHARSRRVRALRAGVVAAVAGSLGVPAVAGAEPGTASVRSPAAAAGSSTTDLVQVDEIERLPAR
jgi:hypothetical protein